MIEWISWSMDLLVDGLVGVEAQAATRLPPVHDAQLLSCLRLANLRVGLLINFHEPHLKDGVKRLVNRL